jgi:hypothetical protein
MNGPLKSPVLSKAVRVFVSYSHADLVWMQRLAPLFEGMPRTRVETWNDKEIRPGERWDKEIKDALGAMDVFVALVSANFGVSPYIRAVELAEAKKRHRTDRIEVLPVLLGEPASGDCDWLRDFQWVPPEGWATLRMGFPDYDRGIKPIREGIKDVIERARRRK